jgi:hypothetical protein
MAYTDQEIDSIFNEILLGMISGKSLKSILKSKKMPSTQTFYKWIESDDKKMKRYLESSKNEKYLNGKKCKSNPKGSKAESLNDYRRENARITNLKKYPNSNIYVLKAINHNYFKIGVSQNIERRLRDVNSSSPIEVELLFSKKIRNAYDLERFIHELIKDYHLRNEWFEIDDYSVLELVIKKIELWQDQ